MISPATALLCALLSLCALADDPPIDPGEVQTETLPRVIVHLDLGRVVMGHLAQQDASSLTIRTVDGRTRALTADRIRRIEHLHDTTEPLPATVTRTDGRVMRGVVERDDFDGVTIVLDSGLRQTLARGEVHVVTPLEDFKTRYERMASLRPLDRQAAHLSLCRWLIAEEAWPQAVDELKRHVERYRAPTAVHMLRLAEAHVALRDTDPPSSDEPEPDERHGTAKTSHLPPPVDDDVVNLIRVYEVDLTNPPRLRIDQETRRELLEAYPGVSTLPDTPEATRAFMNGPDADVLAAMFALRARPFYARAHVAQEPTALRRFRQNVHDQWLMTRCASTACHGGPDAGRFMLHTARRMNDRVRTSNLLILDHLELDDRPMINWDDPGASLLVQHALPRDVADDPHPAVDGFRPALPGTTSGPARATVAWIESMMRNPRPDYPVEPPLPARASDEPRIPR